MLSKKTKTTPLSWQSFFFLGDTAACYRTADEPGSMRALETKHAVPPYAVGRYVEGGTTQGFGHFQESDR